MGKVQAAMAGTVFQVLVAPGDEVEKGQAVIILESMKMEIPVESEIGGKVKDVQVAEGDFVNEGDVLLTIE